MGLCSFVGFSLVALLKLRIAVASSVAEHGLQGWQLQQLRRVGSVVAAPGLSGSGSIVVVRGLSCYTVACGILPDQVSNPYLFHWQVDYLALNHQGSSIHKFVCDMYEIYMNINVNKTLYEMHLMLCCFLITSSSLFLICSSYTALLFSGFPTLHFFQYYLSHSLRNFILFLSFDHLSISLRFLFWVLQVLRHHEKITFMTVNTQSK